MRSWLFRLTLITVVLALALTASPVAASTATVLPTLTAPTWVVQALSTWLPNLLPAGGGTTLSGGTPDPPPGPDGSASIDPNGNN